MSTSNLDSSEFTASECWQTVRICTPTKATESSESNQSSSSQENEENEVYPPEDDRPE